MGVLSPAGIVSNAASPGTYYGMREFAKQYMGAMYCARAANGIYKMASGATPAVVLNGGTGTTINNRVEYHYNISDTNAETGLAGGAPICGVVKFSLYGASTTSTDMTEKALATLRASVQKQKYDSTQEMMADIKTWVDTWPVSIDAQGWDSVDSAKFNEIVKKHEDQVATKLASSLAQQGTNLDKGMEKFINDTLVKGGWASAGGWFQRVGMMRGYLSGIFSEPVGSVSEPTTTGLPRSEQTRSFVSSVTAIPSIVQAKANDKLTEETKQNLTAAGLQVLLPKDIDDSINISVLERDMTTAVSRWTSALMESVASAATGAGSDGKTPFCGSAGEIGGSINRMKCIGDFLAVQYGAVLAADVGMKTVTATARVAAGVVSGGKFMGTGLDVDKVVTPFWDWVMAVPIEWLSTISKYLQVLAFYFGVVIPSFPYTVFMVVVVGWILAAFQTAVAMPLWCIMHMTPDRTFIGSQTQGYLMLLALFARPTLAILGLFAAMLVSDPIITYIAKAFFGMHKYVAMSTGAVGSIASLVTFFWWLIVFAMTLMPVMWMIYGLPQALPDEALRLISAGIGDLGASSAIPEARGGHRGAFEHISSDASARQRLRADRNAPQGQRPTGGDPGSSGGSTRGGRRLNPPVNLNDQGVTPSS